MKLIKRIFTKAGWVAEAVSWLIIAPIYRVAYRKNTEASLTIGITTYKDRFDNCLKPLIAKIHVLFPENQIIVIANGHVLKKEQKEYILKIERFCEKYRNVELVTYEDPMGLSFMWNTLIKKALNQKILILNDDIRIKTGLINFIRRSGVAEDDIATINSSWSHFLISDNVVKVNGWFDEGLKEIGGEDDDYLARLAISGIAPGNYNTDTIARRKTRRRKKTSFNSYGKDMSKERGGYSTSNTEYLEHKWEVSSNPVEGGVIVPQRNNTYWKLRTDCL